MPPREAPTLGEGPGDKLVEEANHPAQLSLAALLAVAHGSSSQRWGGTQTPPSQPANSPSAPPSSRRCPGEDRAFLARSGPADIGCRSSPAGRAQIAPGSAAAARPRSQAAGCRPASFGLGCSCAGWLQSKGAAELASMPLPGLRVTKADHKLGEGAGCLGNAPAVPARRPPPCSKVAGSSGRRTLGAGDPSGASQLSGRHGDVFLTGRAPGRPGSWSAPCQQLDSALHAPAGQEPEAGWYGNSQTPQVPLTNEALLHPRAASFQEQGRVFLPEGSRHGEHCTALGISAPLPLPSALSIPYLWASIICSSQL